MWSLLSIVSLILKILDRYLEERNRTRVERENEEFKESVARRNLDKSADMLSRRLRRFKDNRAERQRANRASSNRPR